MPADHGKERDEVLGNSLDPKKGAVSTLTPNVPVDDYKERLRWQLARGEAWVGNADTKATIILGMIGAITAATVSVGEARWLNLFRTHPVTIVVAAGFFVALLVSLVSAAFTIRPDIGPGNDDSPREPSLFHFADVASWSILSFRNQYREMTLEDELRQLERMVHVNSKVLTAKFSRLDRSVNALVTAVVLGLILFGLVWFGVPVSKGS